MRSERLFCEQLDYNMLYRWFLDMNMVEESFVPTVFTKNHERLIEHDVAKRFFAQVVEQARLAGLMSDQRLRAELNARFPERREIIDGALCAVLSGEHVLLLGPPGTAKSAFVRALAQAFSCRYFERLLTKFSTPEELFGPVSLRALEADRFESVVVGKLPEAEFAFIDECFKGNSAILNSLLTL